jgi:opacity protein-like surface antigen
MDWLRPFVVADAVTLTLVGAGQNVSLAADVTTLSPPLSGAPAHGQSNLAWVAMAGAASVISRNLQIDPGYRYLNLGNVQTADGSGGHMTFKNVAAQEFRVGLRWSFDDLPGVH